jgi:hypothetical protein
MTDTRLTDIDFAPDAPGASDAPSAPGDTSAAIGRARRDGEPVSAFASARPIPRRGPLASLLDLFSSIWLGVVLLTLLFIYSSIGSAYPPFRQMRGLEMTEYEWFHWWPFNLLIALICINIIVATLRRIPLNIINLGVWMIHSGIITLAIGSVWYFSTKLEGDAPVIRRQIAIELPTGERGTLPAIPGAATIIGSGANAHAFRVSSIDPQWELLSGEDKGRRAYSVNVTVRRMAQPGAESTGSDMFVRQLIAGYPHYTEDLVRSDDPNQPFQRAKKLQGEDKPLIDDSLKLSLEHAPQQYFYLANNVNKSWTLYLREVKSDGTTSAWAQRPIEGMPLYHDYFASAEDVWQPGATQLQPHPLNVSVTSMDSSDPLAGQPIIIDGYLRHAQVEERRRPGGEHFDPAVSVRLRAEDGRIREYQLVASDPQQATAENGLLAFRWIGSEDQLERLHTPRQPTLRIAVPGSQVESIVPLDDSAQRNPALGFTAIEGTSYSYRVQFWQDGLQLDSGEVISVAVVEIKTPEKTITRWVADDPSKTRDFAGGADSMGHSQTTPLDEGIDMRYQPGDAARPPVTIIAGPDPQQLRLMVALAGSEPVIEPLEIGRETPIASGISLTVELYAAHTQLESKPAIVPVAQRDPDMKEQLSMVRVAVPGAAQSGPRWVPYSHYVFDDTFDPASQMLRRFPMRPATIALDDGRMIEVLLSRRRLPLPAPVVLEDFKITSHVGGFTGESASIRDWTSIVRFVDESASGTPRDVSVNQPIERDGFWFFQSQWDPPTGPRFSGDASSAGLNYTVLGVGNRNGVNLQLAGCILAVLGMIFAFYVKPAIRRRQLQQSYASLASSRLDQPRRRTGEPPLGTTPLNGEPTGRDHKS